MSESPGVVEKYFRGVLFDLQDQFADFLKTGRQITDAKARAAAYLDSSNSAVAQQAQAVVAKANGLLNSNGSIQSQGLDLINRAGALQKALDKDQAWQNFKVSDPTSFGWGTLKVLTEKISQVAGMAADLLKLKDRMDAHVSDVQGLQADVSNLDAFAQGRGVRAALTQLSSGLDLAGSLKTAAKWGAIGFAAYLFLPGLLGSLAKEAKGALK